MINIKGLMVRSVLLLCLLPLVLSTARAQIFIEPAFPALTFESPVDIQHAPDGTDRIFVVEQSGQFLVFPNNEDVTYATNFLDIKDRVTRGYEEGLLGLAFHPQYAINGRFYIYYNANNPLRSIIASLQVSATNPDVADLTSEEVILEIEQPFPHHNGGQLRFGRDGYLYISVGDGGGFGEDTGTGEDLTTLLGSILRIDVDDPEGERPYSIPDDNPFAGNVLGYCEEIYAYGLRNPWRFSFDLDRDFDSDPAPEEDDERGPGERIWVGDVGGGKAEEINLVESGRNYGWSTMEGEGCHARFPDCTAGDRMPPVWEYGHGEDRGWAVIGGFVYRGERVPLLADRFIYGDYRSGRIWALDYHRDGSVENTELLRADTLLLHAFGEDESGELYVAGMRDGSGRLYRFGVVEGTSISSPDDLPRITSVQGNFPNPFRTATTISYTVSEVANVEITVYDVLGREVRTLSTRYISREVIRQSGAPSIRLGSTLRRASTSTVY